MISIMPLTGTTTAQPQWMKYLMSSHTLNTSQSLMPDTDTGQSSWTPNPVCSPPLTPHMVNITFYVSPFAYPAPRMFSRKGWIKYWKNVIQGYIAIADDINIHGHKEAEYDACLWKLMKVVQKYGLVFNSKKTQVQTPVMKFFGCL